MENGCDVVGESKVCNCNVLMRVDCQSTVWADKFSPKAQDFSPKAQPALESAQSPEMFLLQDAILHF